MSLEVKAIAALALLVCLTGFGFWGYRQAFDAGYKAGAAEVQTQWDADREAIAKVSAEALADANRRTQDALEANQGIHDAYEARLATVSANAGDFARRLRDAEARLSAGSGPVSAHPSEPGSAPAGQTTSADQLGTLAGLTADLHAECTANADQLDSLIDSINRQMKEK